MSNRKPLEALLDVMVYAPIGAALTVGEELPRLADKGRAALNERLGMARVVGQFAVNQGRREAERRLKAYRDGAAPSGEAPSEPAAPVATGDPAVPAPATSGSGEEPGGDVRLLAIPGYDSLSAPQVVQRLAGLSAEEREAVRDYEASHRARQTILARVAQLHDQQ